MSSKRVWRTHLLSEHAADVPGFELGVGWETPEEFHSSTFPDCQWKPLWGRFDSIDDLHRHLNPARELGSDREFPGLLAVDSLVDVPTGAEVSLEVRPQTIFAGTRIAIPRELATQFELEKLHVGPQSQLPPDTGPIPCSVFASDLSVAFLISVAEKLGAPFEVPSDQLSEGPWTKLETCQITQVLGLVVRNKSGPPARFVAGIVGRAYR